MHSVVMKCAAVPRIIFMFLHTKERKERVAQPGHGVSAALMLPRIHVNTLLRAFSSRLPTERAVQAALEYQ